MTHGHMLFFNKHSVLPQEDKQNNKPGEVVAYTISEDELAKYRQLPPVKGKKPISLRYGKKRI